MTQHERHRNNALSLTNSSHHSISTIGTFADDTDHLVKASLDKRSGHQVNVVDVGIAVPEHEHESEDVPKQEKSDRAIDIDVDELESKLSEPDGDRQRDQSLPPRRRSSVTDPGAHYPQGVQRKLGEKKLGRIVDTTADDYVLSLNPCDPEFETLARGVQPLPQSPRRSPPVMSEPGAYPQGPSGNVQDDYMYDVSEHDDEENPPQRQQQQEQQRSEFVDFELGVLPPAPEAAVPPTTTRRSYNHDHSDSNTGLVEARPVEDLSMDVSGTAQPMRKSDTDAYSLPDSRRRGGEGPSKEMKCLVIVLLCCVVLLSGILTAVLASQHSSTTTSTANSSNDASSQNNNTTEEAQQPLPFSLPDATLQIIRNDVNLTTAQAKAYAWMKADPYISHYSERRLLQRFLLVLFYFSTEGPNWTHQGGGTVTVFTDHSKPGGGLAGGKPGGNKANGGGKPGGGSRWLSSTETAGTTANGLPSSTHGISGNLRPVNITSKQWLSYEHSECEWFSMAAASKAGKGPCDVDGVFQVLDISRNNLGGIVPVELGLLDSIKSLTLSWNPIQGSLGEMMIGRMTNLKSVRLHGCDLYGALPSDLGFLSILEELMLVNNQFTGTIPSSLGHLTNVNKLHLGQNDLSGTVPPGLFAQLSNLRGLDMDHNRFHGPLPTFNGVVMKDLSKFRLDANQFSSTIASEWATSLPSLLHLSLKQNSLTGQVPSELGLLSSLLQLDLSSNKFSGTLPPELANLAVNGTLYSLNIADTGIQGTIPEGLCGIGELLFDCSSQLCGCSCACGDK